MDKDLKNYYQKQIHEITNKINCCDYTDNRELIDIIDKLANIVQSILQEL